MATSSSVSSPAENTSIANVGGGKANIAMIVGGVAAGTALFLIGVATAWLLLRRRRRLTSGRVNLAEAAVPFTKMSQTSGLSSVGSKRSRTLDVELDAATSHTTVMVTVSNRPSAARDNEDILTMLQSINERVDGRSRPPEYTA